MPNNHKDTATQNKRKDYNELGFGHLVGRLA